MDSPQTDPGPIAGNMDKAEASEALFTINQSLQVVIANLDRLKTAQAVPPEFAEVRRLTTEQLRSEINLTVSLRLHTVECRDAYGFEQQRLKLEKELEQLPAPSPEAELTASPDEDDLAVWPHEPDEDDKSAN